MKLKQIIFFIIPCFIWGSTWFAIKFQLGQVDPLASVAYRFFIAGILLLAFCGVKKLKMRYSFTEHLRMALQGLILFGFNYWLVYLAEMSMSSGVVAIIFSLSIFANIFFNYFLLKGKLRPEVLGGAVLGILGTLLIYSHEINGPDDLNFGFQALMFCFGSITLASLGNILSKFNQSRKLPVLQTNAFSMTYGSLAMMAIVPLSGKSFSFDPTLPYVISLFYLAIFGSIVAFTFYLKLVGDIGPDRAGYATLLTPVIALVISSFFENYEWTLIAAAGILLLFAGNAMALKLIPVKRKNSETV
jgi:drug/metabolite transporter (DMT)-like permease